MQGEGRPGGKTDIILGYNEGSNVWDLMSGIMYGIGCAER